MSGSIYAHSGEFAQGAVSQPLDLEAAVEASIENMVRAGKMTPRQATEVRGQKPVYLLRLACQIEGAVCPAGNIVEFPGTPNIHMQPLNDAARARVAAWSGWLPK